MVLEYFTKRILLGENKQNIVLAIPDKPPFIYPPTSVKRKKKNTHKELKKAILFKQNQNYNFENKKKWHCNKTNKNPSNQLERKGASGPTLFNSFTPKMSQMTQK